MVSLKLDVDPSSPDPNQLDGISSKFLIVFSEKASLKSVSKKTSKMQQRINKICLANFIIFFSLPITSRSRFFRNEINRLLIHLFAISQNNNVIPNKLRKRNHSKFNSCIFVLLCNYYS